VIFNKSDQQIDSFFVGQHVDAETIASYLSLALGYNFLQGPLIETGNPDDVGVKDDKFHLEFKNLLMTSLVYWAAGGT